MRYDGDLRLVYDKVLNNTVERLTVPCAGMEAFVEKANLLAVMCEEQGVTHNFSAELYMNEEWLPVVLSPAIIAKLI